MARKRNASTGESSQDTWKAPAGEQVGDADDAVLVDEKPEVPKRQVLVVRTRHRKSYRRAGRVFDLHSVELDTSLLSPEEVQLLVSDPWLVAKYEDR